MLYFLKKVPSFCGSTFSIRYSAVRLKETGLAGIAGLAVRFVIDTKIPMGQVVTIFYDKAEKPLTLA